MIQFRWAPPVACVLAACVLSVSGHAWAKEEVEVSNAWARATVPGQTVAAAYMTLKAKRNWDVIAVTAAVAESSEIHNMIQEQGVAKMRPVGTLELKAGKPVILAPGGMHVMLMGLRKPLKVGEVIEVSLQMVRSDGTSHTQIVKTPVKPVEYGSDSHDH